MKINMKIYHRGTTINKIELNEWYDLMLDKGMDADDAYNVIADESNECIYISNGFVNGLLNDENEPGEWHHYFVKQSDGSFEAAKYYFNA
jgi:hypothetical protein